MSQLDINEYFTDNEQRNTFFFHKKLQRLVPLNHTLSTSGNRISPDFTTVQQKSAETQLSSVYLTTARLHGLNKQKDLEGKSKSWKK